MPKMRSLLFVREIKGLSCLQNAENNLVCAKLDQKWEDKVGKDNKVLLYVWSNCVTLLPHCTIHSIKLTLNTSCRLYQ